MPDPAPLTATEIRPKGHWHGTPLDRVVLRYDDRFRRRILLVGEGGTQILLSLKDAQLLNSGDALVLDGGGLIEVVAAPEKLVEVTCDNAEHLLMVAWHLGNRHLATEISERSLRIRYDKVILEMVTQLGASTWVMDAPFNPEGGAYRDGQTRVHSHHHHDDGPDHDHGHHHHD